MATIMTTPSRACGDPREKTDDQEDAAEELDARDEGAEDLRRRDAPVREVLDDHRQVSQLAPARAHEDPARHDAREERSEPRQVTRDAARPFDQCVDQECHD
jgi:hypothetical protein